MKIIKLYIFFCILFLILCLSKCPECPPTGPVNIKLIFKSKTDSSLIDTIFYNVYGIGGNGSIYPDNKGISTTYELPLSLVSDSVTYVFDSYTNKDTLSLSYKRRGVFISEDCGYHVYTDSINIYYTTFLQLQEEKFYDNIVYIYIYL